jgi:hypothetical protein
MEHPSRRRTPASSSATPTDRRSFHVCIEEERRRRPLLANGDPAQGWIPLPTASAATAAAAAASKPQAHPAAATTATSATTKSAATATAHVAAADVTAAHVTTATAAAVTATPAAAASSTSRCEPYAWTELSFFVEDVERRQADVEHLLLGEINSRFGALRRCLRCGCVC